MTKAKGSPIKTITMFNGKLWQEQDVDIILTELGESGYLEISTLKPLQKPKRK